MPEPYTIRTTWEGYYLDGQSAVRHRAVVSLFSYGLVFSTEDGGSHSWPYADLRQTQGFYAGEPVRLERGGDIPELLVVPEPAFLTALSQTAPQFATRAVRLRQRRRLWLRTSLAAIGAIVLVMALYLWGIPVLSALVASRIPLAWEERLGREVVAHIAPPEKQCTDPIRLRFLEAIITTLTGSLPEQPYTLRILVVDDATVNAFAAPGGYIVVFRGLLELTGSAEELAGVLAHEVQHILQHHVTRLLLEHASTGLLLTALTGDVSGAMVFGLESARLLGTLQHRRQHEAEADVAGLQLLLAAAVDPSGMVTLFEHLHEEGQNAPRFLHYLSTHPNTTQRIATLKALAGQSSRQFSKLLPDYDWEDMHHICAAPHP